jgi:indolepyruvate ferredoxin oxidoreductase beta subunit
MIRWEKVSSRSLDVMTKELREFNLIVAGVGGQGSVLASHIVADVAVTQGMKTRVGDTFGAAQRGGKVHSHVRIGEDVYSPLCPEESLDVLLGLEPNETIRLAVRYAGPKTFIVMNTRPVPSIDVNIGADKYSPVEEIVEGLKKLSEMVIAFDATELAIQSGNQRTMNVVLLGALASTDRLPYEAEALKEGIREHVPPRTIDANLKAFSLGWEMIKNNI